MPKTITQRIVFKNTAPKDVYSLYMNAKKHSHVTGGPTVISAKIGTDYSTHGGYIKGKNLELVRNKLIVQTWRTQGWDKGDTDSILTLSLEPKGEDVVLHVVHANLPNKHAGHIDKGWHNHYWKPMKQHLAGKPITRPKM